MTYVMWGLIVAGAFIGIGLHRVGNAIDGLTQALKEDA